MSVIKKLSRLVDLKPLEADQEGLLRGGFAMIGAGSNKPAGQVNTNCDCDCGCNGAGCGGNANCDCNGCKYNTNCNCDCGTASPTEPTNPTGVTNPTNGSGISLQGFGLFTF